MTKAAVLNSVGPIDIRGDNTLVGQLDLGPGSFVVIAKVVCVGDGDNPVTARLHVSSFGIEQVGGPLTAPAAEPVRLTEVASAEDTALGQPDGYSTLTAIVGLNIELFGRAECFCGGLAQTAQDVAITAIQVDEVDVTLIPAPLGPSVPGHG